MPKGRRPRAKDASFSRTILPARSVSGWLYLNARSMSDWPLIMRSMPVWMHPKYTQIDLRSASEPTPVLSLSGGKTVLFLGAAQDPAPCIFVTATPGCFAGRRRSTYPSAPRACALYISKNIKDSYSTKIARTKGIGALSGSDRAKSPKKSPSCIAKQL